MQKIPFESLIRLFESEEPLNIELALNVAKWHNAKEFENYFGFSVKDYENATIKPILEKRKPIPPKIPIIQPKERLIQRNNLHQMPDMPDFIRVMLTNRFKC